MKAINTYDTSKNIKLATYASRCIENEILMLCEEQLPEYYWPCEIEFNESLPLTPIGKIDYLKLEKEDYEKQLAATKKLVKK